MPKRTDIQSILIIGAGPIVIGQACEFDYSGAQACKALREEGYRIILVNSNPATIMTDPDMADATYIEPLTMESLSAIIEKEKPQALLPTVGGQTALNLTVELKEAGILDKNGVELIGANIDAIERAEDREQFKEAMENIDIDIPQCGFARSMEDAKQILEKMKFPIIIRPSFTLGGTGASFVHTKDQFEDLLSKGLHASPIHEVLIDKAVLGWKEYELELLRDDNDNVIIICSIENFDPMGIHTGDSITVAPAMTLSDTCYQRMRDMAIKMMRSIGDFAGGCNVQFAVSPDEKEDIIAIEINPRVSRSSALASRTSRRR